MALVTGLLSQAIGGIASGLMVGAPLSAGFAQGAPAAPGSALGKVIATVNGEDITEFDLTLAELRTLRLSERFEVVVNLLSIERRERVRVRVQVPESDPSVATLFDMFPGTEAMEREVFDMFGITFTDHPDLTRILMPEDWDGHPLRKDYDQGRIPVQFTTDFAARNPR